MAALEGHQSSRIQHQCLTALVFCTCLMLAPSRSAPTQPSSQPGVTLFHQGDDALNWDHDELVRVRTLHSTDVSDAKEFLASDNVASYLKLSPVEALHMPVPVNIVFVGFAADGNMHVNISAEQMQKWFGHLDHVLPHTRVQLSELSCAEDGHCAGMVHGTVRAQPVKSYVHLNFSCNVVVTRRGELAATFERAIHVFSRPVDPEIEMGAQQVDAERMEKFVDNFLSHLGILESGYTLVVLNPTWTVTEPVYGYRLGLSQAEMDVLLANIQKVRDLLQSSYMIQEPELPVSHSGASSWMGRLSRNQQKKFGAVDATWSGDVWVESMKSYLNMVEDYRTNMLKSAGAMSGAAALAHAATIMKRTGSPMSQVLHDELLYTDPYTSVYSKFRTMHPAEDCLVGNWVGHQRWALVDLTAGGFDWGPALGGEGVVHKHSLPSVMDHFSKLHGLRTRHLVDESDASDKHLMADLSQQTQAHKSQKANTAYMAFSAELSAQRKSRSPDEAPLSEAQSKEDRELAARKWRVKYQETLLKAELEMNEQFAARNCAGASSSSKACMQIKDKSVKARGMLAKLAGAQATSVDVWRDLRWDVFGPEGNLEHESDEIADEAQRSRDLFLGELNGVLSRALRHVVAPPTATWTHAAGYLHDTATPFAKHVVFDIYMVRESVSISADQTSTPQFFNLAAYQDQVFRLALPGQKFEVRRHDINLHDDVVLASAFAAAQHSIAQEIPSEPDMVQEAERIYVDSRVLSHVLRKRFTNSRSPAPSTPSQSLLDDWEANEHGRPPQKEGSKNHNYYEVPVFIFELHRDYAVLLDEHYNAKALEDMILVVHNSAREDEHPTGMMCGGALLARPLSPLREALSATLTHLSGVLPPHLGYSPGRHKVQHDWLWSVGSHPHSFTSIGTTYSELQRDALARSYLLDAIDSSLDAINEGIATLMALKPTPLVHKHIKKNKAALSELLSLWPELLAHWRSVMDSAWHLNWGVATMQLGTIEDRSLRFMHLAQQLAAVPKGGQCAGLIKPHNEHLVLPTLILSCFVGAWAVAWLIWPAVVTKRERGVNTYALKF